MTNREFVVWLSGFFEMAPDNALSKKQLYIINNHLNLAETVEGALGDFNIEIREIVKSELERLETEKCESVDENIVILLKDKVLSKE